MVLRSLASPRNFDLMEDDRREDRAFDKDRLADQHRPGRRYSLSTRKDFL